MSFIDITGMNLAQERLNVISNNIANANTVGFKASSFNQTLASMSFGSSENKAPGAVQSFSQGTVSSSGSPFNLAINGNGLFQLDNNGIKTYTRDGQFTLNKNGAVVDATGDILTGYKAVNGVVQGNSAPVPLIFTSQASKPVATTTTTVGLTLNSLNPTVNRAGTVTPFFAPLPFDSTKPATYTCATTSSVYDALGAAHDVETFYTRTAVNSTTGVSTWDVNAIVDGVVPSGSSLIGTLTFDASGKLTSSVDSVATASTPGGIAAAAAAADSITAANLMTSTASASNDAAVTAAAAITSATSAASSVKSAALASAVTNSAGGSTATVAAVKASTAAAVSATTVGTADRAAATALKTLIDNAADAQDSANAISGGVALDDGTSIINAVITAATAGTIISATTTATAATTTAAATAITTAATANNNAVNAVAAAATAAAAVVPQYTALSGVFNNALTINATSGQKISLDLSQSVQYATSFGAINSQDGYPSGQMTNYTVGADGTISALYSTGNTEVVGQVALATFKNLNGLASAPNNQWSATYQSGAASVGTAGSTALGLGLLSSSSVEDSNVNLVNEMVNMISAQRAFQAQSSVIKTQDQNLQTVVGLKQ